MSLQQRAPKLRHACNECHASKVRCTGERTGCRRCVYNQQTCTYSISMVGKVQGRRRRISPLKDNEENGLGSNLNTNQTSHISTPVAMPQSPRSVEAVIKSVEDAAGPEVVENRTVTESHQQSDTLFLSDGSNRMLSLQGSSSISSRDMESSDCQGMPMDFESLWDFGRDIGDDILSISCEDAAISNSNYEVAGSNDSSMDDTGKELTQGHKDISPNPQTEPLEGLRKPESRQRHLQSREQPSSISPQSMMRHGERSRDNNYVESMSFDPHPRHNPRNSYTPCHIPSPTSPSLPSTTSFYATSKCLIIIGKLQKLLLRHSSLSLDVILSTNKSALSELMYLLDTSPIVNEDYFSPFNSDISQEGHSVPLMIYVITLKHIYDLYIQACHIFKSSHPTHSRSPSVLSPLSPPSSYSNSHSSLPQLDFGIFKIDAASQRRLFSEIILRELDNFLVVYGKVKGLFENELDDISTQMGLVEEMFLSVKEGIWKLSESIRT